MPRRMEVLHDPASLPGDRPSVVTIGSFDGVHRGHRALLDRLVDEARRADAAAVAVTFDPHPRRVLGAHGALRRLTDTAEQAEWIAASGVDYLAVLPFDRSLAALSGAAFADRYLIDRLRARMLVVGFNHRFGHDRLRAADLASERLRIVEVAPCLWRGEAVSSTAVRRAIDEARFDDAEELLGHPIRLTRERR